MRTRVILAVTLRGWRPRPMTAPGRWNNVCCRYGPRSRNSHGPSVTTSQSIRPPISSTQVDLAADPQSRDGGLRLLPGWFVPCTRLAIRFGVHAAGGEIRDADDDQRRQHGCHPFVADAQSAEDGLSQPVGDRGAQGSGDDVRGPERGDRVPAEDPVADCGDDEQDGEEDSRQEIAKVKGGRSQVPEGGTQG